MKMSQQKLKQKFLDIWHFTFPTSVLNRKFRNSRHFSKQHHEMSNTQLKIDSNLSQLTSEEFWRGKEEFQTALQKSPSPVLIKNDLISAFQVVNIVWKGIWKSILFPEIFRNWRGDKHRPWDQPQNSLLGGRFWHKPWKNQKEKWLVISGFCLQYNFAVIDAGRSLTSKDSSCEEYLNGRYPRRYQDLTW